MAAVVAVVVTLALGGCSADGGASDESSETATAVEPQSGGVLRVIESSVIAGLDPVQASYPTTTPLSYSAIYGNFLVPDPETGEYECGLCESFETSDNGATWDISLRDGITFSDGTPFDAEAVKYNWERIKDPANGASASLGFAQQIDTIEVVDDLTLRLTMTELNPGFKSQFTTYVLQWIASPTALAKGTEEFNKNPIGAGPFLFESWTQGGVLRVVRNPDYYDAPRPYLDAMEIQGVADTTQRVNALLAGSADLIMDTTPSDFATAEASGFVVSKYTFNGGQAFMMNMSKPPFDDIRARQALAYALDLDAISDAATGGYPAVPSTLFNESSPLYADIPLATYDPEKAQELFDELAAEGNPLEFTYTLFPTQSSQATFEALQAQLGEYDNVTVVADQRDGSEAGTIAPSGDFQMLPWSLTFADPIGRLWGALHSEAGTTNYTHIADPALDAALDAANVAGDDDEELAKQFEIVQERLAELVPYIIYGELYTGTISSDKVNGIELYGFTTPQASGLWLTQ
ncbi:MAG: ABC transporter substrate-binding protein [Microbacterium sp.]